VGQLALQLRVQHHLHGEALELRVAPDGLDVADGQTDQQVHQQDGHDDHEHDQDHEGGERVRQGQGLGPGAVVGLHECPQDVDLAQHHREGADQGHGGAAERQVVALEPNMSLHFDLCFIKQMGNPVPCELRAPRIF